MLRYGWRRGSAKTDDVSDPYRRAAGAINFRAVSRVRGRLKVLAQ